MRVHATVLTTQPEVQVRKRSPPRRVKIRQAGSHCTCDQRYRRLVMRVGAACVEEGQVHRPG